MSHFVLLFIFLVAGHSSSALDATDCEVAFRQTNNSAVVQRVQQELVNGEFPDWENGIFPLSKILVQRQKRIQSLTLEEKESLKWNLRADEKWSALPASYRQFVLMHLYDREAWGSWLDFIHRYGLPMVTPIRVFQATIGEMPDTLREQLIGQIAEVYNTDSPVTVHPYLEPYKFPNVPRLNEEDRGVLRKRWEVPKRVFTLLIHLISNQSSVLAKNLAAGMPVLEAYQRYLSFMDRIFPNAPSAGKGRSGYSASDVHQVLLAMQSKLRQLASDPNFQESNRFFGRPESFFLVFGSFPNGLADFSRGSDIDLAVASEFLAYGREALAEKKVSGFGNWGAIYPGSQALEMAAVEVIKRQVTTDIYDPIGCNHRCITEKKLFSFGLDKLSPILFRVSPYSMTLIVRPTRFRQRLISPDDNLMSYNLADGSVERDF